MDSSVPGICARITMNMNEITGLVYQVIVLEFSLPTRTFTVLLLETLLQHVVTSDVHTKQADLQDYLLILQRAAQETDISPKVRGSYNVCSLTVLAFILCPISPCF